jgi:TatD DNase family protein
MQLVDTHTHLYLKEYDADQAEVVQRALDARVSTLCLPNIDRESIEPVLAMCDRYPTLCFPMLGIHPTEVTENYVQDLSILKTYLDKRKFIAIGEIGIDLHWDKTMLVQQIAAFEEQLRWCIEYDLPVAIHSREAFPEVFESLYKVGIDKLRGVFHSFGGSKEELEEVLQCKNFFIGINGVITYKNANFREYLALAPLDRIVLETDAPFLTPVPFRGKRNESAYVPYIAEKVAEVYGVSVEEVAKKTTDNARRLFNF